MKMLGEDVAVLVMFQDKIRCKVCGSKKDIYYENGMIMAEGVEPMRECPICDQTWSSYTKFIKIIIQIFGGSQ